MNLNSSRLKLAYVVKYYYPMPRISGILRFVQDLIRELERDFSVRVFTSRYSRDIPAQEEYRRHQIQRLSAPFPLRAGAAVRRWRPDVIIFGSGFWRPYYLLPYWELFRLGLGRLNRPVILTQYTNMTGRLFRLIHRLRPAPDRIITTTEALRVQWERFYPGKVAYIPPGLPLQPSSPDSPAPVKATSGFRIGYFGHLQPHKGPDILLRIFQEMNPENADLLINGEGKMMENLKVAARGWKNITIQGYVPDVDPWLRSCSLLVLPFRSSVSVLGYSRAALDALAFGIPVIGTPSPSLEPLIEDGKNGFICRDEEELKERIQSLIDNPELRKSLSAGAIRSSQQFNIKNIARRYKEIITQILLSKL